MRTPSAALALALLPLGSLAAQICPDQEFVPTGANGLEVTNNQSVAQTFTVGLAGKLTTIEILGLRHHRGVSTNDLRFELLATSGGVPTADVLAALSFSPTAIATTSSTFVIDLSALSVCVLPGEVYAIHLDSDSPSSGSTYAWSGTAPGTYAAGESYIRRNIGPLSFDMGFRTHVDKTPGLTLCLSQPDGDGSLQMRNLDGMPSLVYATTISFDPANGGPLAGQGIWAGLHVSVGAIGAQLNFGVPFIGILDANGRSDFLYPGGTIPDFSDGMTLYAVTRSFDLVTGAFPEDSNISSVTLR